MDKATSAYLSALDELNVLTATSYYTTDGENVAKRIDKIADDVLSFLIMAYTLGIENASIMLMYGLLVDVEAMEDAIFLRIDGKTFADRVAAHVEKKDLRGLQTLVESEYHRVYNTAVQDGAAQYMSSDVYKTWYTVKDDRVRDTHRYLEGQTIRWDERFYTWDGDDALYPGGFFRAENNVNCRCIVTLRV